MKPPSQAAAGASSARVQERGLSPLFSARDSPTVGVGGASAKNQLKSALGSNRLVSIERVAPQTVSDTSGASGWHERGGIERRGQAPSMHRLWLLRREGGVRVLCVCVCVQRGSSCWGGWGTPRGGRERLVGIRVSSSSQDVTQSNPHEQRAVERGWVGRRNGNRLGTRGGHRSNADDERQSARDVPSRPGRAALARTHMKRCAKNPQGDKQPLVRS